MNDDDDDVKHKKHISFSCCYYYCRFGSPVPLKFTNTLAQVNVFTIMTMMVVSLYVKVRTRERKE